MKAAEELDAGARQFAAAAGDFKRISIELQAALRAAGRDSMFARPDHRPFENALLHALAGAGLKARDVIELEYQSGMVRPLAEACGRLLEGDVPVRPQPAPPPPARPHGERKGRTAALNPEGLYRQLREGLTARVPASRIRPRRGSRFPSGASGSFRFVPDTLTVELEHWCPNCDKLFRADLTVEWHGKQSILIESSCSDCGTRGRPLLKYDRR